MPRIGAHVYTLGVLGLAAVAFVVGELCDSTRLALHALVFSLSAAGIGLLGAMVLRTRAFDRARFTEAAIVRYRRATPARSQPGSVTGFLRQVWDGARRGGGGAPRTRGALPPRAQRPAVRRVRACARISQAHARVNGRTYIWQN